MDFVHRYYLCTILMRHINTRGTNASRRSYVRKPRNLSEPDQRCSQTITDVSLAVNKILARARVGLGQRQHLRTLERHSTPPRNSLDACAAAWYALATEFNASGGATMTCFTHNMLELTIAAPFGVAGSLVECAF